MEVQCEICGKKFIDNYLKANNDNHRIWCADCINKKYKEFNKGTDSLISAGGLMKS